MCKSKEMGGQRCPGHAAQNLSKKRTALAQVQAAFAAGEVTQASVEKARKDYWTKLVDWSSTTVGAASLREQLAAQDDQTSGQAQGLRRAIDQGALLAQSNREAENAFRAARGKGPLETPVPLTFGQEAQAAAEQAERAAREAAAAADPLGLRAAEAVAPQVTLPEKPEAGQAPRPALPTHRPIPAPTATMLPTAMPAAMANRAQEQAQAFEALTTQSTEGAAARAASDQAAAEAQRAQAEAELQRRLGPSPLPTTRPTIPVAPATQAAPMAPAMSAAEKAAATRAARAGMTPEEREADRAAKRKQEGQELWARAKAEREAEAAFLAGTNTQTMAMPVQQPVQQEVPAPRQTREQVAEQRALGKARNAEVTRLRKEITARNKRAVDFARGDAIREFTAPANVWEGPARFTRNAAPATPKENWAAMRAGSQAYGKEFENLVARHAGRYTPAEVLEACQALHQKGYQVASGGNAPSEAWYASYQHLDRGVLNQALGSLNSEIGPKERAHLSQRYIFANADGMLNRTLEQHGRAPRHMASLATARAYARWRRFEDRARSSFLLRMLMPSGPAYS